MNKYKTTLQTVQKSPKPVDYTTRDEIGIGINDFPFINETSVLAFKIRLEGKMS